MVKLGDPEYLELLAEQVRLGQAGAAIEREPLGDAERRSIVDGFVRLLEGLYAHLPQKRASYGFDPSQRLRLLGERIADPALDDDAFHREMAQIITDLRDAHTRYLAPQGRTDSAWFLPVLVERYRDGGIDRFIASKITAIDAAQAERFAAVGFDAGVEVRFWNGRPIGRAVDRYAHEETGGRPDARVARALESLTIRPTRYGLAPDEAWVDIGFVADPDAADDMCEIRIDWTLVALPAEAPTAVGTVGRVQAYNPIADQARQVKKMLFAHGPWLAERQAARAQAEHLTPGVGPSATDVARRTARDPRSPIQAALEAGAGGPDGAPLTGRYGGLVYARNLGRRDLAGSGPIGYLRVFSFAVDDDQAFVAEVAELIGQLPQSGLIIDLRSNPGGNIWAAEAMLQLFTPHPIEPARFTMLATDMTRAMTLAPQNRSLAPWAESLRSALATGVSHSRSEPLTPRARCNNLGQCYPGPVVAIVDANTYSAGDLFAAGFVDNRVGKLICTDRATGGGGANVWTPATVAEALADTGHELPDLAGASYTISARRAERTGPDGQAMEDAGVASTFRRALTRRDLLDGNADLLAYAARHLAAEPLTAMSWRIEGPDLVVTTAGIDRLTVTYDGVVHESREAADDRPARFVIDDDHTQHWVEVAGYDRATLRQRRLITA